MSAGEKAGSSNLIPHNGRGSCLVGHPLTRGAVGDSQRYLTVFKLCTLCVRSAQSDSGWKSSLACANFFGRVDSLAPLFERIFAFWYASYRAGANAQSSLILLV